MNTIYLEIGIAIIILTIHYGRKLYKEKYQKDYQEIANNVKVRLYQQHDSTRIELMDEIQAKTSINSEELKTILANRQSIQSDYRRMIKEQKDKKILEKLKTKVNI